MARRPRVISLFSGAGGLDYGFEAAGFATAVALEVDPTCCETLRLNRRWPLIERSIFDVPSDELLAAGRLRRGEADVLIGGPPCQPFSKAGYWARGDAGRLTDPRADTLAAYTRVLEDTLPTVFLLENVEGLAFSAKSEGLALLLSRIDDVNRRCGTHYRPAFQVVSAAAHGVPQLRERFIMIGARDGATFTFPSPTHGPDAGSGSARARHRTAWDALGDLAPAPGEDLVVRGKWAALLPSIPEGENYLWHTERGGGMPLFGWRRRYWSFLLKLAKDRPSWTIPAQPGPATGPFHWTSRPLSGRELCRLQTFPDDVRIAGGRGAVQRQVGNAVPSLLAEVLARAIRTQLLGLPALTTPPRLLPPDRSPAPPAEPIRPVPPQFHHLRGEHAAHPGTGQGYRAAAWRDRRASAG